MAARGIHRDALRPGKSHLRQVRWPSLDQPDVAERDPVGTAGLRLALILRIGALGALRSRPGARQRIGQRRRPLPERALGGVA